ncbi:hypothetical protein [Actinomadura flavalba]|uniref:hypothetical protein n=1 Tax=Actinomadura flavalba TaxID=1120938 RepID=UPI0003688553|nr:hypothetical protein [Actinomadura flavalba]
MSLKNTVSRKRKGETRYQFDRAQDVARSGVEAARQGASTAAERIGPAAQQTRVATADGILAAREWSAPRLERAAKYVESDLAPKVSAVLSDTAQRVEPPKPRRGRKFALTALVAVALVGIASVIAKNKAASDPLLDDPATDPEPPATTGTSSTGATPTTGTATAASGNGSKPGPTGKGAPGSTGTPGSAKKP